MVVAIAGLALTMLMVWQQRNTDYNKAELQFSEEVRVSTDAIAKRIDLYTEIVAGLRDLFLANPRLTRAEFERIAMVHNVIKRYPEIINVRFIRWYPGRTRQADRYVIEYLWPEQGNEDVRGMDITPQEANMDALFTARDTGLPAVTAPFFLAQDNDKPAIVLRMPVYRRTPDARLAGSTFGSFRGAVGAAIDVNAMLHALSETGLLNNLGVRLLDTGLTLEAESTEQAGELQLGSYLSSHSLLPEDKLAPQSRTIDVFGRRWELQYTPAVTVLPSALNRLSWWIAGGGMALTLTMVALTMLLMRRRAEVLQRAQAQISWLTYHDPLTQLPNRHLLRVQIQKALRTRTHGQTWGALMLLDLDHFKNLNEIRGHEHGDNLLIQVAHRLRSHMPAKSFLARQGDDEFVILTPAIAHDRKHATARATELATRLLEQLRAPYLLADRPYHSTVSLGITLFHGELDDVDTLLQRADLAMHQAKLEGRDTMKFYDPAMEAEMTTRATLEHDLRQGLEQGQFELHFQPQVNHGDIIGAEALLRWKHPERGWVPPAVFIPLAERTGMIVALGEWVITAACQQLAAWAKHPEFSHLHLSVNISPLEFHQEQFVGSILAALRRAGAPPRRLRLELTESMLLHDINHTIAKMDVLQRYGVTFSLDDFGTGYSSLSYLNRLPLKELKIDQSFVRRALEDDDVAVITQTIIALGRTLQLQVLAEGVETAAQRNFLIRHGCHLWQGYLFGRPASLAEFQRQVHRDTGR